MNATVSASSSMIVAGASPAAIAQKMQSAMCVGAYRAVAIL
jgi:hypothetical protein